MAKINRDESSRYLFPEMESKPVESPKESSKNLAAAFNEATENFTEFTDEQLKEGEAWPKCGGCGICTECHLRQQRLAKKAKLLRERGLWKE